MTIESRDEAEAEIDKLRDLLHQAEEEMVQATSEGRSTEEYRERCQNISLCALSIMEDWEL